MSPTIDISLIELHAKLTASGLDATTIDGLVLAAKRSQAARQANVTRKLAKGNPVAPEVAKTFVPGSIEEKRHLAAVQANLTRKSGVAPTPKPSSVDARMAELKTRAHCWLGLTPEPVQPVADVAPQGWTSVETSTEDTPATLTCRDCGAVLTADDRVVYHNDGKPMHLRDCMAYAAPALVPEVFTAPVAADASSDTLARPMGAVVDTTGSWLDSICA